MGIGLMDRLLLAFYDMAGVNARRAVRLCLVLLPLIVLLVGSCRTQDMPASYGSNAGPEQFRIALFPDRVNFRGDDYKPAAGYVSRARKFVTGMPATVAHLTEHEIVYLFGKPQVERRDADARIGQYRTAGCVVDFFFYETEGGSPVSHVDYRAGRGAQAAPTDTGCLQQMTPHRV